MNLKLSRLSQQLFRLIGFGVILWLCSAAALAPGNLLQTQTTPPPTSTEIAPTQIQPTSTVILTQTKVNTPTPFPDWAMTSKDTNGILLAGVLILLIITIGTLAAITKGTNFSHPKKNR